MRPMRSRATLPALAAMIVSCTPSLRSIDAVASELEQWREPIPSTRPATDRSILQRAIAVDPYVCSPSAAEVFGGQAERGIRTIHGSMPHYGLYDGPMRYHVQRTDDGWIVRLRIAVRFPNRDTELELPDCSLRERFEGPVGCWGIPFEQATGVESCPDVGRFRAVATRHNVSALLAHWSTEAEGLWNRDAQRFGLPIRYDFDFIEAPERGWIDADATLPLEPTCGRTPYFRSLRSGWSIPVLAHEVGHWLGLLDEYEMLSGIAGFYPKTPFPGAEVSRMGLSMKRETVVLPLHHYLVLRRYFCPEPESRDPYEHLGP